MTTQEGMQTSDVSGPFTAAPAMTSAKRVARVAGVLSLPFGAFGGVARGFVYRAVCVGRRDRSHADAMPANAGLPRGGVPADLFQAKDALHWVTGFRERGARATTMKQTTRSKATGVMA
jgi:hypothetical protein